MRNGFTLLETLAALAVAALMLGSILSAQSLILRAEGRARAEPPLRCAIGRLLVARLLGTAPDENAPPAGVAWRASPVKVSDTNSWQRWDIHPAEYPAGQAALFFAAP